MKKFIKLIIVLCVSAISLMGYSQTNNTTKMTNANVKDTLGIGDFQFTELGDSLTVKKDGTPIMVFYEDSVKVYSYTMLEDTLFLHNLSDAENDEQFLGLSRTNGVFADSTSNASEGLGDSLPNINDRLRDTVNGEIGWCNKNGEYEYTIKGRPSETIYKLQHMIEHNLRYIQELTARIEELEVKQEEKE